MERVHFCGLFNSLPPSFPHAGVSVGAWWSSSPGSCCPLLLLQSVTRRSVWHLRPERCTSLTWATFVHNFYFKFSLLYRWRRFQSHMQTKGDCVTPQQKRTSCWDSSRSTSRSHKVQRLFADKTITRDGSLLLCPLLPLVREWWAAVTVSCADYGTDGPPFVTALASSSAEQQGSLIT